MRKEFERTTPESVGIKSQDILHYIDTLEHSHYRDARPDELCVTARSAPRLVGPLCANLRHGLQVPHQDLRCHCCGYCLHQGILKLDEEQARIFANRVEPLQEAAKEVHLHIGPGKNTQAVQQQLGGIFAAFHGKNPVYLHVADTKKVIRTNPRFWVDLDAPLRRCHRTGAGEGEHGVVKWLQVPCHWSLREYRPVTELPHILRRLFFISNPLYSRQISDYLSCNSVEISVTELGLNYLLI